MVYFEFMDGIRDYRELVEKARNGDEESMSLLASAGEESLRRYVFRITLDESLTQDIVQEVLLEMVRVFDKLKRGDRFISWLHGIAFNRLRRHYGDKWRSKLVPGDGSRICGGPEGGEGLANLVNAEVKQIIFAAMGHLEPRHRAVLTMRCYDGMSYKEIAETMGMRELSVRALFYRAKNSLAKQLSRRGLGRGSLLTALVLFGKMTAVSESAAAEVAVTAATLKVGMAAGAVGAAGGQAAAVAFSAAATVMGTAAVVAISQADRTVEAQGGEAVYTVPATIAGKSNKEDMRQFWYYYPEGVDGPVMMRKVVADHEGRQRYCQWLQNDKGNYRYDPRSNTITLESHRMWQGDYSVTRLPTDSPELADFISEVQGDAPVNGYIGSRGRDLLIIAASGGADESSASWTTRHCNALEEDYFKCDWPRRTTLIDGRDDMRRRGWTYFVVEGQAGGRPVRGTGQMPFVYAAGRTHRALLSLRVGDHEISGDVSGLCVHDAEGRIVKSYSGVRTGGIFAGIGRPWEGLHTIDTIRRDAARRRIRFETAVEGGRATVVLDCGEVKMVYAIDMEGDLVEEIQFVGGGGGIVGELRFSYMQEIDGAVGVPSRISSVGKAAELGGDLWLVRLASGCLMQ